jgi:tetratricopeptide (TPR) repeat protein
MEEDGWKIGSREWRNPMSGTAHFVEARMRYEQALEFFKEDPNSSFEQLMVAICLTQLKRYRDAMYFYDLAIQNSLKDRFWYRTNQPNWLVDAYKLASRADLFPQLQSQLAEFVVNHGGESLVELYACGVIHLLSGRDEKAKDYVTGLLKKPKIKDTFAMGQTIAAIIGRDQLAFDAAMDGLLRAHRGMAKFGALRETPEGFLCLPAMSLSAIALERGLEVNAESEYLSKGYLDHLLQHHDLAS